ncbi:MAG: LysR family transcriptional regulator [Solirubrobacteraceae bacterium]
MLDLRRLRVFREVATRRSFSAAALSLSYTQSSVSQAVADLEAELGVTLLERSSRPVRPTPAGEIVLGHAEALLGQAGAIEDDLAALGRGDAGRLRLGGFSTAWATFLPVAVAAFSAAHPRVELVLEQFEPALALRRLRSGDLDVAVIYRFGTPHDEADPGPRSSAVHLFDDPYALAVPARHPLARRGDLTLAELAGERWVTPPVASAYTQVLQDFCRRHGGFEPTLGYEIDDVAMAQPLVAAGLAVALLPRLNLVRPHPGIVVRDLPEGPPARSVWSVRPADRRVPAARAMVGTLTVAAREAGGVHPAMSWDRR